MVKIEQTNIIQVFVESHKHISSLLEKLKTNPDQETFDQLETEFTKHIKQEELLYAKYRNQTGETLPILQKIKEDHATILETLANLMLALRRNEKVDFSELLTLNEQHKNMEERLLYPELDKEISEEDKEEVMWNVRNG